MENVDSLNPNSKTNYLATEDTWFEFFFLPFYQPNSRLMKDRTSPHIRKLL
jgi:hypothetical protein